MPILTPLRVLLLWLFCALVAGRLATLADWPVLAHVLLVLLLAVAVISIYRRAAGLRRQIDALDLRWLVAPHLLRFAGIMFVQLGYRGVWPEPLAFPAGAGGAVTAAFAVALLFLRLDSGPGRRLLTIWNVVGLVDILLTLVNLVRWLPDGSAGLEVLTTLPLSLWPTFLAPLLLATHLILFMRLGGGRKGPPEILPSP